MFKSFIIRLFRVLIPQLPAVYAILQIDPDMPANTELAAYLILGGGLMTALDKLFRNMGWYAKKTTG